MSKYITISEIFSKIKSRDDIQNYFREQGNYICELYTKFMLYYPTL